MGHATPHSPALPYDPRPLVRTGKSSRGHFGRRLTERTTSHGLRPLERVFIGSIKPNPPWFDQAQRRCRSRNRFATYIGDKDPVLGVAGQACYLCGVCLLIQSPKSFLESYLQV